MYRSLVSGQTLEVEVSELTQGLNVRTAVEAYLFTDVYILVC